MSECFDSVVPYDVNDVNLWLTLHPLSKMRADGLTLQDVTSVSLKIPVLSSLCSSAYVIPSAYNVPPKMHN